MFDFHIQGYTHRQWRSDPQVMVRVAAGAIRMFDYDVFMLHPDDLIEYEGMGIGVTDEEDLPPAVSRYLPPTAETLRRLREAVPKDPAAGGRLARHLEGLRAIKGELGRDVCLTGRIAAPVHDAQPHPRDRGRPPAHAGGPRPARGVHRFLPRVQRRHREAAARRGGGCDLAGGLRGNLELHLRRAVRAVRRRAGGRELAADQGGRRDRLLPWGGDGHCAPARPWPGFPWMPSTSATASTSRT